MAEFNAMDTAAFKGVWVFCEQREGEIQSISYQLLSEGRKLANDLGVELSGVVMGSGLAEADLKTLGGYGADRVYNIDSPLLKDYTTDGYAKALCDLIMEKKPEIMEMLYKATPTMMALEEKGICQPVAAPSVCERSYHVPSPMRAMTKFEVKRTIQDFIDAAVRCKKAGVDLVELHAAHGYLIQQFLSPNTNHRKDEYGGSFDNRLRFISEIITGIKAACGKDYPLMVRLSADEMYDRIGKPGKGYDLEEGKRIAKRLEELGVDAINVSSACYDTYNYWL